MLSLDDEWFDSVLKACYHNPRAERERRRRVSQLNSVCSLHAEDSMGKPQKKSDAGRKVDEGSGSSRKSTPAAKSSARGVKKPTPDSSKSSPDLGQRGARHRPQPTTTKGDASTSSGTRSKSGASGKKTKDDASKSKFDLEYAIRQTFTMFQGKDCKKMARQLFDRTHPDVTGANIVLVGRTLGQIGRASCRERV